MKIILAGDLHIGRQSSGLPARLVGDVGSTTFAWERLVEATLAEGAGLLCLSGDLADGENRFWEAVGPLERGVRRLADAGVQVVAVAGNHDHDALPRLAGQLANRGDDAFVLLGHGGRWQRRVIEVDGRPVLDVLGWSFPQQHVRHSPLNALGEAPPATPGVPTLGLVHGDLDQPASDYAPLDRDRLDGAGCDAWLLGHVHVPRLIDDRATWILYPGSPQAMDAGEQGPHGYWITELAEGGLAAPTFRPLSDAAFGRLEVDLTGVSDAEAIDARVLDALEAKLTGMAQAGGAALRAASVRLRLTGMTRLAAEVPARVNGLVDDLQIDRGGVALGVDDISVEVLPEADLEALAARPSGDAVIRPPGMLAELLLDLQRPSPRLAETRGLLERIEQALEQQDARRAFMPLRDADQLKPDPADYTERVARDLLARLLNDRPTP